MIDNDTNVVEVFDEFVMQLYGLILAKMPIDTGNMFNHTRLEMNGYYCTIIISGQNKDGYDYAYVVNENKRRGKKERKNYHYVERCINQAARIVAANNGGKVDGIL